LGTVTDRGFSSPRSDYLTSFRKGKDEDIAATVQPHKMYVRPTTLYMQQL